MDWGKLIGDLAGAATQIAYAQAVHAWLDQDADAADSLVCQFVQSGAVEAVDQVEASFYVLMKGPLTSHQRTRLMRHYAMFKVADYARFRGFRGFPKAG